MTSVNMIFFMGGPQLGELEAGLVASLFASAAARRDGVGRLRRARDGRCSPAASAAAAPVVRDYVQPEGTPGRQCR